MSSEAYELGTAQVFRDFATPFDALKTAEQHIQFSVDPSKALTRRRYGFYSNNTIFDSSYLAADEPKGTISIDTTATGTDTARIRSALVGQYVSQTLAQPGMGMELDEANVTIDGNNLASISHGNIAVGAGWHDGSSGGWGVGGPVQTFIGLQMDSGGANAVLVSNGSHLGDSPVSQSNWNIDPMDGTGPSGLTFKPQNGYIYNFPYTWYAYGALFVGIIHPEKDHPVLFHKFSLDRSSFDRPNIAPLAIIDNGGTASSLGLDIGGMQYTIYGANLSDDGGEERGTETSRLTSNTFVSDQVATSNEAIDPNAQVGKPLFAVRRQAGVRDIALRLNELNPEPENDVYLFAWDEYDETTALDGTWREPNEPRHSSETLVQVNTTCTSYTPTTAVSRGWDKATTAKQNEPTLSQLATDDRIPIDATRVYTAVHDGTGTDMEIRGRIVEGY